MGLDSGEAIVSSAALDKQADQFTILEAALDDVEQDLRRDPTDDGYRAAFRHLYGAAAGLRGMRLRPRALVRHR